MSNLELSGIHKQFGGVAALRNVSLCFHPGEITAVVGDNGAGKSTLLRIIAGTQRADSGQIVFGGSIDGENAAARRKAGIEMVYQDLALAPQQDIAANLFVGRELTSCGIFLRRREMRRIAQQKLSELGVVVDDVSRRAGALSGGEQQAVAIARALLFNPRVLLLDEPTAALGAKESNRVLELIGSQREHARIVVLVSHRLNDVLNVADRVVVLKRGSVVLDAPTAGMALEELVTRIVD